MGSMQQVVQKLSRDSGTSVASTRLNAASSAAGTSACGGGAAALQSKGGYGGAAFQPSKLEITDWSRRDEQITMKAEAVEWRSRLTPMLLATSSR
mmetsp:Transcript_90602/g.233846  ORF Transcript_90602/g.233846 Transcript_90602/m.233846 type:complete len:95 (+) Transcript_90602:362-646(+)